jgi:hypothetical protein
MAKVADNELLKLRATRYNNIAVGMFIAGAVGPYIILLQTLTPFGGWLFDWLHGNASINGAEFLRFFATIMGFIIAWVGYAIYGAAAERQITKIEN